MKVSSVVVAGGFSPAKSAIDRKIQALTRRKQEIIGKVFDVVQGDDDPKVKKQKVEALRMEIQLIDMEITRLKKKKAEQERSKRHIPDFESDKLPPSPSDLIHPGPGNGESGKDGLDLKV